MHRSEREQPETTESSKDRAPESRPQPGLANRTFTAATLAVGFAIIVVMLWLQLMALAILLGAEFDAALGRRRVYDARRDAGLTALTPQVSTES